MCVTWSQQQYIDAAEDGTGTYQIIGEFVNDAGQQAIMVRRNWIGYDFEPDIYNIYSADGQDSTIGFWSDRNEGKTREQLARAAMTERGFLPKSEATVAVEAVTETVETTNTETTPEEGAVLVFGKTLEEWLEEGRLNEDRDENNHVHPAYPGDREPTEDETQAYRNSLTVEEQEYLDTFASLSVLGDFFSALA